MKFLVLCIVFFCNGVFAVVDQPVVDDGDFPMELNMEAPVAELPDAELSLLKQLKLKTHSSLEDRQHIWDRVRLCEGCHSTNLHAGNGYLPILQGQNLEYLFSKLLMFKGNRSSNHPLGRYMEAFSSDDLMDISYFYAEQPSDLKRTLIAATLTGNNGRREVITIEPCSECHGAAGNGDQLIPAISGQNRKYLSYRIREIADDNSTVHLSSDAPVSCKIGPLSIRKSRQLASLLSVVIDKQRAKLGEQVYKLKCAECHKAGDGVNSAPGLSADWSRHLLQGTRRLVNKTVFENRHQFLHGRKLSFSRNEIKDAIHYMINQLQSQL